MLYTNTHLELEHGSYKDYHGLSIIKPKAFKEYSEKLEKEQQIYTRIIRNTELKDIDPGDVEKRLQDGEDIVKINDKEHYELRKVRNWPAVGYIYLGENLFIRVERRLPIFILLFLGLLLLCCLKSCENTPNSTDLQPTQTFAPELDPNADDYTGKQPVEPQEQESIVVPGFFKFTATSGGSNVQLYNPEENTVYFQYEIYQVTRTSTVETFATEEEALDFISSNQVDYKSTVESGSYVTKDSDGNILDSVLVYSIQKSGNQYEVLADTYKAVYVTQLIEPGKQVVWNAYESLPTGQHTLKFKISTYDIETGAACYGAIQTVEGLIK